LPQSIHRFGEVIQHGVRQNGIESEIIEREFVDGGAPELYVIEAAPQARDPPRNLALTSKCPGFRTRWRLVSPT
jgi:hypothetical protein